MRYGIKLFVLFLLISSANNTLHAQQAVTASGGDASGTGGTASYSIGQVANNFNTDGSNGSENQGVQQPYEFFPVGIDNFKDIILTLSVYPNPASSALNLRVVEKKFENLSYGLYDLNGKLIVSQKIVAEETAISMQGLSRATYFLQISDDKSMIKTFQIIKNN